jgi:hypothetical protein
VVDFYWDFSGPAPRFVTVTTFWRVTPTSASIATGGNVPITILACVQETSEYGDDVLLPTSTQCAPSIRQGTWYVNGAQGGSDLYGKIVPLSPTSSARYDAPLQPPTPNQALVLASLYWAQRGVTKTFTIPISVTGTGDWTGTVTYIRTEDSSWTDLTGVEHHETRDGTGTINLKALPHHVNPQGGQINAESITVTESYTLHEQATGSPDARGCTSTSVTDEQTSGSEAMFPPDQDLTGSVILLFSGTSYTLQVFPVTFEITGTLVSTTTTKCPGQPDDAVTVTLDSFEQAGLDPTGQSWVRDLDPRNPGRLVGEATFTDAGNSAIKVKVKWDLRRP